MAEKNILTRRALVRALGIAALAPEATFAHASKEGNTPPLTPTYPRNIGFVPSRLDAVRAVVAEAVEKGVPGAVLLIARQGRIAVREAYGYAGLRPVKRPMAIDTVFDLASLTKPIAATSAIAHLYEAGKLELDAPASRYLAPLQEAGGDMARFTVRHLLTHTAGLVAGGRYTNRTISQDTLVKEVAASKLKSAPGEKFLYSDYSAALLGAIVQSVSGKPLDRYCHDHIFGPLGMTSTGFIPKGDLAQRCAATTPGDDTPEMRGIVHDPTSRAVHGVCGNAGLFSSADDLARFCQMMLNGGEYAGVRIFKPETVRLFTSRQTPEGVASRGLGWDLDSPYSIRATLPQGSYGHTGFTGTSVWIDPATQTFILLLANGVHAIPPAVLTPLRRTVSGLVAASFTDAPPLATATASSALMAAVSSKELQTGLEVLTAEGFARLAGRKVGVVCNHTALDRQGRHIVDLMQESGKVTLVSLFGPEHSIRGDIDASADDSKDAKTGLPVISLYNLKLPKEKRYRPTPEQLAGIDTLVYDIQDIGARYYTYIATLGYCMEEAAKLGIKVVVLDRPNPIGGELVEGPLLQEDLSGVFTAYHTMPITHGMTVGELAQMFNTERKIGATLEVVKMKGWGRKVAYDQTGLPWVNPSPNIRSMRATYLYPGVGFLESLPISVGRGTDTPFEILGAPYIDPLALHANLVARKLPGVSFSPTHFTPTGSVHKGKLCGGVQINLWDRKACRPSELGIHIADALARLYPQNITAEELDGMRRMVGTEAMIASIKKATPPKEIIRSWEGDVKTWKQRRAPFLLYGG
jgi:uncharacterized protein YbbC (DUF1343 family)/CubicO group peptidase (beta-lactamase class C family)